jgi:uncharacterized protein YciI
VTACFLLTYEVVPDYLERRAPLREAHLAKAREAAARGLLRLGGAHGDPPDGATLVFRTDDRAVVEDFARTDPYVVAGLDTRWTVRPWTVVVGTDVDAR